MTKLLLTSAGLSNQNIINQFLQIIDKPVFQIKVIFIPTASRTHEELKYVNKSKKELLDLGIVNNNIKTINLDKPVLFEEVKNFDVIYVCGGNTFYLLKKIRETGFDKVIKEFVKRNKLYFGVSAGSIIVNPDISAATVGLVPDKNDVKLVDLTGLNLTDVIVSPHYCKQEKSIIDEFSKNSKYKVVALTDSQALLVIGRKTKVIE